MQQRLLQPVGRLAYALQDVKAVEHMAQHHVLAVALGRRCQGQEELAGVGVPAGVGHGQHASCPVLQLEPLRLVLELATVNAVARRAVACQGVPLRHAAVRQRGTSSVQQAGRARL